MEEQPAWVDTLTERLAVDDEFRAMFEKTPGKAANSIGIPYEDFQAMLAEVRDPGAANLADRASALKMTAYGSVMSTIRGALGASSNCACNYDPTRWADYCVD